MTPVVDASLAVALVDSGTDGIWAQALLRKRIAGRAGPYASGGR